MSDFDFAGEIEAKRVRQELRDKFAMAALAALLSSSNVVPGYQENPVMAYSKRSYEYADAMLEARGGA